MYYTSLMGMRARGASRISARDQWEWHRGENLKALVVDDDAVKSQAIIDALERSLDSRRQIR